MFDEIYKDSTNRYCEPDFGLIDNHNKTAIIPDHYVFWVYKVKKNQQTKKWEHQRIIGLFTRSQIKYIWGEI